MTSNTHPGVRSGFQGPVFSLLALSSLHGPSLLCHTTCSITSTPTTWLGCPERFLSNELTSVALHSSLPLSSTSCALTTYVARSLLWQVLSSTHLAHGDTRMEQFGSGARVRACRPPHGSWMEPATSLRCQVAPLLGRQPFGQLHPFVSWPLLSFVAVRLCASPSFSSGHFHLLRIQQSMSDPMPPLPLLRSRHGCALLRLRRSRD